MSISLIKNDNSKADGGEDGSRNTSSVAATAEGAAGSEKEETENNVAFNELAFNELDPAKITPAEDTAADSYPAELELRFSSLNVFSACYMAFAHGANDISNAAGPFIAVWDTFQKGKVRSDSAPLIACLKEGIGIWESLGILSDSIFHFIISGSSHQVWMSSVIKAGIPSDWSSLKVVLCKTPLFTGKGRRESGRTVLDCMLVLYRRRHWPGDVGGIRHHHHRVQAHARHPFPGVLNGDRRGHRGARGIVPRATSLINPLPDRGGGGRRAMQRRGPEGSAVVDGPKHRGVVGGNSPARWV